MKAAGCDFVVLGTIIRETIGAIGEATQDRLERRIHGLQRGLHRPDPQARRPGDGRLLLDQHGADMPYLDDASKNVRDWASKYKAKFNEDPGRVLGLRLQGDRAFARVAAKAGPNLTTESFIKTMDTHDAPRPTCSAARRDELHADQAPRHRPVAPVADSGRPLESRVGLRQLELTAALPAWLDRVRRPRSPRTIALWLALWLAAVANLALWRELSIASVAAQPRSAQASACSPSSWRQSSALMLLTAWGRWMKPVWMAVLLAAGVAQHFMLTYGVVMDTAMLANTAQTDPREVRDLLGWTFLANMLLVVGRAGIAACLGSRAAHAVAAAAVEERLSSSWSRSPWTLAGAVRDVQPARAAGAQQHAPALHRQPDRRLHLGRRGRRRAALPQEQAARADHRRHRARRELRRPRQAAVPASSSSARRRAPITSRSTAMRARPIPS